MRRRPLRLFAPDDGGNPGGSSQAGDPSQSTPPQAGTTTPSDPQAGTGTTPPQKSADDYEEMLAKVRKEAASYRVRLKEFEDAEKKRQEAQMGEHDLTKKQLADLQKSHEEYRLSVQDRVTRTEIRAAAADLGFADLSDAVRL